MKKGFGLLEVVAAALVLGFLLVGLNSLQLGNRETILRIRTRDAANNIAQEVIDSIRGLASIETGIRACEDNNNNDLCRSRTFKSKNFNNSDRDLDAKVDYSITVNVQEGESEQISEIDETYLTKALGSSSSIEVKHNFAKHIDVTVSWLHKKTQQSVSMSAVVK